MDNDNQTAVMPMLVNKRGGPRAKPIQDDAQGTAAGNAYRAKIESLLDESSDEQLADVWQRVCPFRIDSGYDLPNRRAMIVDLADFAVVLQPSLHDMKAHRLCRLIERYAARESRQSDLSVSLLA